MSKSKREVELEEAFRESHRAVLELAKTLTYFAKQNLKLKKELQKLKGEK